MFEKIKHHWRELMLMSENSDIWWNMNSETQASPSNRDGSAKKGWIVRLLPIS